MSTISLLDYLGVDSNDFSWQALAMCRGDGDTSPEAVKRRGDIFFDTYETDPTSAVAADSLCAACPVRSECAFYGQENRQWGLWGGVYWDGSGKPDLDRNAHKTWEEWQEVFRYAYVSDKVIAEIKRRLNVN